MILDQFQHIAIVGFKRSGIALCRMLLRYKKDLRVTDTNVEDSFGHELIKDLKDKGVQFEFGAHHNEFLDGCDLLVISPGVDIINSPIGQYARKQKIPVYGEMEVASWLNRARIVAITGTNGKTTTAFLTYKVLKSKFGEKVHLAGNIGIPFSEVAPRTKAEDIVVLEVSSFQLETIKEFHPFISCITNIEPDHLDRYAGVTEYIQAKKNIFLNQTKEDFAVLNENGGIGVDMIPPAVQVRYFSDEFENENYSAVSRIAGIFGIDREECGNIFSQFCGLPHRMQKIKERDGVVFINDSKATNPSSTLWALQNVTEPIRLIAGGKDKGLEYSQIKPYLGKVKKVYLYGEAKGAIAQALSFYPDIVQYDSLEKAIHAAAHESKEGETVLFSPMCSSFDLFKNYQERGRFFVKIVNDLDAKASTRT